MRFMKFLALFIFLTFNTAFFISANQAAFAQTANEETSTVELNKDNIKDLIETLESETARTDFLENLKTMAEAQNKLNGEDNAHPNNAPLIEKLGMEDFATQVISSYESVLQRYNLNSSIVGKLILTVLSAIVSLVVCFIVFKLSRMLRDKLTNLGLHLSQGTDRFRIYARSLRYIGYIVIFSLFTYSLSAIWDVTDWSVFNSETFRNVIGRSISVFFVILIGITIWEILSSSVEFAMQKTTGRLGNRFRTLLPIARNAMFAVFVVLFALVILSELSIDIMPLLAGAGIVGIAIGFGAQTLVKDFLNGFIIILEDLIQIGDVAKVGDRIGLVERITIRKVQLRDLQGIVYTVPFSDISVVENWTKDFSFYLLDVGVAYREDTDEVIKYLKEIDEDLRADEEFSDKILEPIEILGVDAFADSAVIIKARIKTIPIQQWNVGREFNRRMKYKFDEKGVEIPFPHQTIYFGEDKKGNAPPAHLRVEDMERLGKMRQEQISKSDD